MKSNYLAKGLHGYLWGVGVKSKAHILIKRGFLKFLYFKIFKESILREEGLYLFLYKQQQFKFSF
jgi:hypothetical protein